MALGISNGAFSPSHSLSHSDRLGLASCRKTADRNLVAADQLRFRHSGRNELIGGGDRNFRGMSRLCRLARSGPNRTTGTLPVAQKHASRRPINYVMGAKQGLGDHPSRLTSTSYCGLPHFDGGNTGSNPVGDANFNQENVPNSPFAPECKWTVAGIALAPVK